MRVRISLCGKREWSPSRWFGHMKGVMKSDIRKVCDLKCVWNKTRKKKEV